MSLINIIINNHNFGQKVIGKNEEKINIYKETSVHSSQKFKKTFESRIAQPLHA